MCGTSWHVNIYRHLILLHAISALIDK